MPVTKAFEVVFVPQGFFFIPSFDVQEKYESASLLAVFCGTVWKAAKELKTRVKKPVSSVLWFRESQKSTGATLRGV